MDEQNFQNTQESNRLIKFFRWIKTSLEDDYNHASHRKLTTFAFVVLTYFMVFTTAYKENNVFPEFAWYLIVCGALGMSGLRALASYKEYKEDNKKRGD